MNIPSIEVIPERSAICSKSDSTFKVLVRIFPPRLERKVQRPPLNLALVLDRSGSMSGAKLGLAQEAACNLVSNLTARDRVAIVSFDDTIDCVAPSALVTDVAALHRAIRKIYSGGQTALHQAWVEGGLQVGKHLSEGTLSRVILMTDGQANVGESDPDTLASHASQLAQRGISTTTMGIGADYDEVLLDGMARGGDGNFYHIESSAQFEHFFGLELMGLVNLVGSKVSFKLSPTSGVKCEVLNRLDRVAPESASASRSATNLLAKFLSRSRSAESDATQTFRLPNLISEVPVEICLALQLDRTKEQASLELFELELRWQDAQQKAQSQSAQLALPVVSASAVTDFPENPEVMEKAILLEIAALKLQANESIRANDIEEAKSALERARSLVLAAHQTSEMVTELQDLDYIQKFLERGQFASVSKHAYYQSSQRTHSKTSFSSGREARD